MIEAYFEDSSGFSGHGDDLLTFERYPTFGDREIGNPEFLGMTDRLPNDVWDCLNI
ncbi:MAG: hypothetical protein OEZ54_01795 [Gemmatimonadota bacterium]|nr:hypothetical protein [Gemmatimonadota bacterium]